MSAPSISSSSVSAALAPFGALRPQLASEWKGDRPLHPMLVSFYAEVGPFGEDEPDGPDGLTVPTPGNPFWLPPLCKLWDFQAGYRWDARTGQPLEDWPDEYIVVADQGGDPFILDRTSGSILHGRHGEGTWQPTLMFADIFVMALALAAIGAVHERAGEDLYDADFEIRPAWRVALRTQLASFLGTTEGDAVATRLEW